MGKSCLSQDLKLDKPLGRGYFGEVWYGPSGLNVCGGIPDSQVYAYVIHIYIYIFIYSVFYI